MKVRNIGARNSDPKTYRVSVDAVEEKTYLDFFSSLSDDWEKEMESKVSSVVVGKN